MRTVRRRTACVLACAMVLICGHSSALSPPSFDTFVYFAKDSVRLEPEAVQALDALACRLGHAKVRLMMLDAHAASDEAAPFSLAQKRALAVRRYIARSRPSIESTEIRNLADSQPLSQRKEANQAVDIQFVFAEWPSGSASCAQGARSRPVAR